MRTSSRHEAARPESGRLTEPYTYPPAPDWRDVQRAGGGECEKPAHLPLWRTSPTTVIKQGVPEEEVQKREKRARARGAEEGKSQVQAEYERSLTSVRQEVADAVKAFQSEREAYYHRIETEVVQLALSMARHILHRESQLDPSLLAGVVRVALGKFEAETGIRLRVHRSRLDAWRDSFAYFTDDKPAPELVPDDSLRPDQCILETPLGSTDLSLETQLKEIAQGFFDLLAQRPGQLK